MLMLHAIRLHIVHAIEMNSCLPCIPTLHGVRGFDTHNSQPVKFAKICEISEGAFSITVKISRINKYYTPVLRNDGSPPPTARRAEIMTFQFSIPCYTLPRGQNTLPTGQTGDQNYALCPAIPN